MKPDTPLYMQIAGELEAAILSGRMQPGTTLPSIRELAAQFQVNANTAQRAVTELKQTGLIKNQHRGRRMSVISAPSAIESHRRRKAEEVARNFITQMKSLGYSDMEIRTFAAKHI